MRIRFFLSICGLRRLISLCEMRRFLNTLLSLILMIPALSCSVAQEESGDIEDSTNIYDTWMLEKIVFDNNEILEAPSDTLYWFELREDGQVLARSNCNTCHGLFELEDDQRIDISLGCTRAVCGISNRFEPALGSSYRYSLRDDKLILEFQYPTDQIMPNSGDLVFERLKF